MQKLIKRYAKKYLILVFLVFGLSVLLGKAFESVYYKIFIVSLNDLSNIKLIKDGIATIFGLGFSFFIINDLKKAGFKHSWLGLIAAFSVTFAMVLLFLCLANNYYNNELQRST